MFASRGLMQMLWPAARGSPLFTRKCMCVCALFHRSKLTQNQSTLHTRKISSTKRHEAPRLWGLVGRTRMRSACTSKNFNPHTVRTQRSADRRARKKEGRASAFQLPFVQGPRWPECTKKNARKASSQELSVLLKELGVQLGGVQLCKGTADVCPARLCI